MRTSEQDECLTFVNDQLQANQEAGNGKEPEIKIRAVTISRQCGCGAREIATKLADYLAAAGPKRVGPWMVMDRELVETVLRDHHLPERFAKFMPEDRMSEIEDVMDDVLGVHPASEVLVRKTALTILHLVEVGKVILIGRGANVVTGEVPHVFHVRLVGSFERRLERVRQIEKLDRRAAEELIRRQDRGRSRYLKKYYRKDIDDPLLYHVVINTDLVSDEKVAQMIATAVAAVGRPAAPAKRQ